MLDMFGGGLDPRNKPSSSLRGIVREIRPDGTVTIEEGNDLKEGVLRVMSNGQLKVVAPRAIGIDQDGPTQGSDDFYRRTIDQA